MIILIKQTVRYIFLLISFPDEELFFGTAVGCTAPYFVKIIYDIPVGFVPPPPILRLYIALFAVAEVVAVARYPLQMFFGNLAQLG